MARQTWDMDKAILDAIKFMRTWGNTNTNLLKKKKDPHIPNYPSNARKKKPTSC